MLNVAKKPILSQIRKLYPHLPDNCQRCKLFLEAENYKQRATLVYSPTFATDKTRKLLIIIGKINQAADRSGKVVDLIQLSKLRKLTETELSKYLVYVLPIVRCYGEKVTKDNVVKCSSFVAEEIARLNPDSIIAMGKQVQDALTRIGITTFKSAVDFEEMLRGERQDHTLIDMVSRTRIEFDGEVVRIPLSNKETVLRTIREHKLAAIDLEWNIETTEVHTVGISSPVAAVGLPTDEALPLIRDILTDPGLTLVNHNLIEDLYRILDLTGVEPKCDFIDTMVRKRELMLDNPVEGLKDIAWRNLGIERYWDKITTESYKQYSRELADYAAGDAFTALYFLKAMGEEFAEECEAMGEAFRIDSDMILPVTYMLRDGIAIDYNEYNNAKITAETEVQRISTELAKYGIENPNSHPTVLATLRSAGLDITSTAEEVLKKTPHPIADLILEFREWDKLRGSYLENLLEFIDTNGIVRFGLKLPGTISARLASFNPAIQTIPKKLRKIYRSIFGEDGELGRADASQSEFRCLGYLSRSPQIRDSYARGVDFHSFIASLMGVPRDVAKTLVFGAVYGASDTRLILELVKAGKTEDEAKDLVKKFREVYNNLGITRFQQDLFREAKQRGYVVAPYGRRGYRLSFTNVVNYPIQAFSGDLNKLRIIKLFRLMRNEGLVSRIWLEFHDAVELDIYKPEKPIIEKLVSEVNRESRIPDVYNYGLDFELPLEFKIIGTNWG